ncbi:MAG TPA: hypothetical protein VHO72_11840 [Bacteroidales bacterium]|nr:hypothetical protein [Bacteroidales bacterium]
MIEYSNIIPSELVYVARLVFGSKDYYSDWIEYENGKLGIDFKCDKCENEQVKIYLRDYTDFTGLFDDKYIDQVSLKRFGGFFESNSNKYYHCNIDSFRLVKCKCCDRKYLIAFGYNEHQPSRDIYKLLTIFEMK